MYVRLAGLYVGMASKVVGVMGKVVGDCTWGGGCLYVGSWWLSVRGRW